MEMDLYLKNINQEMIDRIPRDNRIPRLEDAVTIDEVWASWTKTCCVIDCSLPVPDELVIREIPAYFIRKERDGGFLWNKETGEIYQLDEQAYQLFSDLDAGVGIKKAAAMHALPEEEIKKIIGKLRHYAAKQA